MPQRYIGVTLPIRLGNNGMFEQSQELITQVRSNFKNLILTKKGERISQPDLGCDLWKVLFDSAVEDTYTSARLALVDAVDRWLPYLEITDFEINQNITNPNLIDIKCAYRFRNNPNVRDQISISTNALGTSTVEFTTEEQEISEFRRRRGL